MWLIGVGPFNSVLCGPATLISMIQGEHVLAIATGILAPFLCASCGCIEPAKMRSKMGSRIMQSSLRYLHGEWKAAFRVWPRRLVMFLLAALPGASMAASPVLMRFPNTSTDGIVFEAYGNLWTTPLTGGAATQLTHDLGENMIPRYSPDGKWIAYTSIRGGIANVFAIPSTGGEARQLTVFSQPGRSRGFRDNLVLTWTPDSRSVVFLSRRMSWNGWLERPYAVGLDGGLPTPLPLDRAGLLTYSPDGHSVAFANVLRDFEPRKRYYGGQAQSISTMDLDRGTLHHITDWKGTNTSPMWVGRRLYYLSDRDANRRANLWVTDLVSKRTHELTHFTDYDIDFPSYGAGSITFQQGGKLWRLDVLTERLIEVHVEVAAVDVKSRPRVVSVATMARYDTASQSPGTIQHPDYALSKDGSNVALSARGDIFIVPTGNKMPRNLTATSTADEDHPAFSPDGGMVAYTTDTNGEEQVAVRPVEGGPERIVTHFRSGSLYTPVWSPDAQAIAVPDAEHNLWLVPLNGGDARRVAFDPQVEIRDPSFSPDAKWLAFSTQRPNGLSAIHLYDIAAARDTVISLPLNDDTHPVFSLDGLYLYFISKRHELEVPSESQLVFARVKSDGIYAASLQRGASSAFTVKSNPDKPATSVHDAVHVKIDFDGLMNRVAALPMTASDITALDVRVGRVFYRTRPIATFDGVLPGEKPALHVFDLGTLHDTEALQGLYSETIAADGGHVLYVTDDGGWHVADVAATPLADTALSLSDLNASIDPRAEWIEMFERVWRLDRDIFFDKGMDGVNWQGVHDAYAKLMPLVGTREDLNYLLTQMQGELGSSHMVVSGGDLADPSPPGLRPALLGVDFRLDAPSGRYIISKIYHGDNSRPAERSPLMSPTLDVREGDYLLAVNGKELEAPTNPYALFLGVKSPMTLTVSHTVGGPRRQITVMALRDEQAVRQQDWIARSRARVDALSHGRLAYIFIPDMGETGAEEFARQYFPQIDKQGLVVDVRFNRGGYLSPFLLEQLGRSVAGDFINREGGGEHRPREVLTGPKVSLMNEFSSSDGEQFAYFFKQANIGELVGRRTAGSLRGIAGDWDLLDGGSVTIPFNALYGAKGKALIENDGVHPDVDVESGLADAFGEHDRQLDSAVKIVMDRINRKYAATMPK